MVSEDEVDRDKFNKLSYRSKKVLAKYKTHLENDLCEKERNELLLYMIEHDLNSNMIQFLEK